MYDIKLNFINKSEVLNNKSVVIFQKNAAENFEENTVAWKVIKNLARFESHPFVLPLNFEVAGQDSYGNYSTRLTTRIGEAYEIVPDYSLSLHTRYSGLSVNNTQVEISNKLPHGVLNVYCYKGGKIVATKNNLASGQKAAFKFHPRIYIGVVSQVMEGGIMNSAILSQVNTEINLLGISEADIIMTGGGLGEDAEPFNFTLENVVKI
ncbi:hypothetical protein [Flavobacterium sp.]|uniref:hypothetical protein n=1 Tax=Flavobacterium sp. TaxID=239 RepID=UPI0031CFF739